MEGKDALDFFEKYKDFFQNIVNETNLFDDDLNTNISEGMKEALLEHIKARNKGEVNHKGMKDNFFRKEEMRNQYQYKGEKHFSAGEKYGRVITKKTFIDIMHALTDKDRSFGALQEEINTRFIPNMTYNAGDYPTPFQNKESLFDEYLHESIPRDKRDYLTGMHLLWIFKIDETRVTGNMEKLPCLLGLTATDGTETDYHEQNKEFFFFHFLLPETTLRKPTSFDAEVNTCWCGGGITRPHQDPICGTSSEQGFPEFVARHINFETKLSAPYYFERHVSP